MEQKWRSGGGRVQARRTHGENAQQRRTANRFASGCMELAPHGRDQSPISRGARLAALAMRSA